MFPNSMENLATSSSISRVLYARGVTFEFIYSFSLHKQTDPMRFTHSNTDVHMGLLTAAHSNTHTRKHNAARGQRRSLMRRKLRGTCWKTQTQLHRQTRRDARVHARLQSRGGSSVSNWPQGDAQFHRRGTDLLFDFNYTSRCCSDEVAKQTGSRFSCGARLVRAAIYGAPQGRSGEFKVLKAPKFSTLTTQGSVPVDYVEFSRQN